MHRLLSLVLSLLIASAAVAAETRHYIVTLDGPVNVRKLEGIEVQHVLTRHRLLVRASDLAKLQDNAHVISIEPYDAIDKLTPEGRHSAASLAPRVNVNVLFHDDVTFDQARAAVEAAGGTIQTPLSVAFRDPQRLTINIAPANILKLAASETVFGIYGRPLRAKPMNDDAAALSKVTPLFSAPYNLDGSGVTLSMYEPTDNAMSTVDASHQEFGGRVTVHDTDRVAKHGTHVAGTMIAQGINPKAKGMAPAALLNQYLVTDAGTLFASKSGDLPAVHSVADNNSWGFVLGWQQGVALFPVWNGGFAYFGGYDAFYSTPYDKIARDPSVGVLFVHSAGNDGDEGDPGLNANGQHYHVADADGSILTNEVFCYSPSGKGGDCPAPPTCTAGASTKSTEDDGSVAQHCEPLKHPTYGPFGTVNVIASEKNVLAVGAVTNGGAIASFSSRGPTTDGRVKPDLVAQGVCQYSTMPLNNSGSESECFTSESGYGYLDGTSMAAPVVTGLSALLVQQWRQTFAGASPTPEQLKTLLIAGATDLGNRGPDYTFGFGLANAQASVDLIRADAATGSHIKSGTIANGQTVQIPLTVSAAGPFRAVLGWADPEVLLTPPDKNSDLLADKTLVNDLDLKIIDASGNTVLPYVLDVNNPSNPATQAVNTVDNTEEVEIPNAAPGNYTAVITGTNVTVGPQTYVFVSTLATTAAPCTDAYEPNDTPATATMIGTGVAVAPKICSASDVDWFRFSINRSGSVSVTVTAKDTPLTVELDSPGPTKVNSITVAAHTTGTVTGTIGSGTNNPVVPAQVWYAKVTPSGTVTGDSSYTLVANFNSFEIPHRRTAGH